MTLLTYLLTYMNVKAKAHVLMQHVTYKPATLIIGTFVHRIRQFKNFDGSTIKKSRTKGSICRKAKNSGLIAIFSNIMLRKTRYAKVTYHQHTTIWSKCSMSSMVV